MTDPGPRTPVTRARPVPPAVAELLSRVLVAGAALTVVIVLVVLAAGVGSLDAEDVADRGALAGAGIPGPVLAATVVVFALVVGLAEAGLWLLAARLLARGYAWARVAATVLGVANLLVEVPRAFGSAPLLGGVLSGADVMIVVVALALMWSPGMSRYVAAVSHWRSVAAL